VLVHPGFAVVHCEICKERKCFWLYHGRNSCFAATARLACVPITSL
jgi:hypothetical protein